MSVYGVGQRGVGQVVSSSQLGQAGTDVHLPAMGTDSSGAVSAAGMRTQG